MAEIEKMDLASQDLVSDRIERLKELFPEIITETENAERERAHSIDFEKLRILLGDEVDEGQERYAFTWPGKADAIRQSQTVSTATLRPCVEKSRGCNGEDGSFDSDNLYIEGDNLEVLKLLQRGYHGKVKMIYIDPPYNTGHDFVYKDSFGDTIANYKEQAGLTGQSNADTSGRYHSDWLSMMYPRLRLARELLSDDGLIFISIDDVEQGNLRSLCNEVFGDANFIANLIWEKKYTRANDAQFYSSNHDFILCFARDSSKAEIGRLPRTEEMNKAYKNPDNDPRGPWKATPIHARSGSTGNIYTHTFGNGISWTPPTGTYPRYSEEKLADLDRTNQIWFGLDGCSSPSRKTYLSKVAGNGIVPCTIIQHELGGHNHLAVEEVKELFNGTNLFTSPKPTKLMSLLMMFAGIGNNDFVLDFFSGSATMAEAVMRRDVGGYSCRYMLVQLPEIVGEKSEARRAGFGNLCEIGEERIRRAGNKIKDEVSQENSQLALGEEPKRLPDIGFRVFELDSSGIERPEPGTLMRDVVKPDRSELDIVFEMMLKWGLELTLPVERAEVASYPVWSVACDELVCCMDPGLTIDALQAVADLEPRRVLILDSILDDSLKLNAVQIFKNAAERTGSEIELRTV